MTVYKIRNPQGLFSRGGCLPKWSKKGKTWTNIGALKSHLTMLRHDRECYKTLPRTPFAKDAYEGCEVLEFTYVPTQSNTIPIVSYLI